MKETKNTLTIILMLSSIALLLVLQFFWLQSAYNKGFDELRKETNSLFRATVFSLRDSLIQKGIEIVSGDSTGKLYRFRKTDTLPDEEILMDSVIKHTKRREQTARIQVLLSPNENDSTGPDIKPLVSRFLHSRGQGNYILRLGKDSLNTDSVSRHYKNALASAGIELPFRLISIKRGEKLQAKIGSLLTEPMRVNPGGRSAVLFSNVHVLLIKQIVPQILFSLFLTLLTGGSFYVMYRNLVAQRRMAELKNDFINNVTHELKTPITTVGVALEALRNFKGLENPKLTSEYLDIAQNELDRLTLLTDKVLKTAIFEENGMLFPSEKVDLAKLVEQILTSMKLVFEKQAAAVSFTKEGTDFTVVGAADHLTNVVYNLLDNALKYSPDKPAIVVTLKGTTNGVTVMVKDEGIGIPREYQKKIYEKFFRVPSGDVHNIKGYGLGLSYVAGVVERHQGTISLESAPGKGSCFILSLPKDEKS